MSADPKNPQLQMTGDMLRMRYEAQLKASHDSSRAVIEYALLGLRGLTIANGGALIGLVTFLGHYDALPRATGIWWAYALFVIGLTLGFAAILASYLSQTYYTWQADSLAERHALEAVGADAADAIKDEGKHFRQGSVARLAAIFAAVASILCFFFGAFAALSALTTA